MVSSNNFELHENNPLESEFHVTKLRENLKLQALELATTRQVSLQ